MPSSTTRPKRSRTSSSSTSHHTQPSPARTEITINVYDLLPPGRLSSLLWTLGSSLLHSGLQIADREYAFGGHSRPKTTGVYFTAPRFEPPGVTFRCGIPQGTTQRSPAEIEGVVREVSEAFLGEKYNLLTNNCNHFTAALCAALTGRRGPAWLNRAASVGLALPCMVPREWVNPPNCDTAEGELVDEEEGEDEQAAMLDFDRRREVREAQKRERGRRSRQARDGSAGVRRGGGVGGEEVGSSVAGGRRIAGQSGTPPPRVVSVRDTSGREMPVAERAPLPKTRRERSDSAGL
ncbi:hypothetical protein LTR91_016339 [Friedmanniomyces endolithicus]|uniref:PPPDE domain-containing protein n=1 Tax=Friedmanniomyces endolithicus TaxID=329885 RepID=A0AAN6K8C7_9PEZI|nr:hypothetical protein LTS01_017600 [Friedmanniomyces endolithicus]KAK0969428.1 hypothetical protein LTR91_016339 [Friedmanniomyces endolithicus]KAK1031952.1 hypothetical protein LTS16_017578 [Friedmanniomyces endolithicus]